MRKSKKATPVNPIVLEPEEYAEIAEQNAAAKVIENEQAALSAEIVAAPVVIPAVVTSAYPTGFFADSARLAVAESVIDEIAKEVAEEMPETVAAPAVVVESLRSEAVKKTWLDPAVRARRQTRNAVLVDGTQYSSLYKAFCALNLPESRHISFRNKLKLAGKKDFEYLGKTYKFEIVPN